MIILVFVRACCKEIALFTKADGLWMVKNNNKTAPEAMKTMVSVDFSNQFKVQFGKMHGKADEIDEIVS